MSLQSADLVGPIRLSTGEQMRHLEARIGTLYWETPCVLLQELGGGNLMKEQGLRMEGPGV